MLLNVLSHYQELIVGLAGFLLLVFGALLAVIGYFLRELHSDFKDLSKAVIVLAKAQALNEQKGKSGYRLLEQRIQAIEQKFKHKPQ